MTQLEKRLIGLSLLGLCFMKHTHYDYIIVGNNTATSDWYLDKMFEDGRDVGENIFYEIGEALDYVDNALKRANLPSLEEAYEGRNNES